MLTFRRSFIRILQILQHILLPNHLLNPLLRLDIKRIIIQQGNLILALALRALLLRHPPLPRLAKPGAVLSHSEEVRSLRAQSRQPRRIA